MPAANQSNKALVKATPVNIANRQITLDDTRPGEMHITGLYQGQQLDQWLPFTDPPLALYVDPDSLAFVVYSIPKGQGLVFVDYFESIS